MHCLPVLWCPVTPGIGKKRLGHFDTFVPGCISHFASHAQCTSPFLCHPHCVPVKSCPRSFLCQCPLFSSQIEYQFLSVSMPAVFQSNHVLHRFCVNPIVSQSMYQSHCVSFNVFVPHCPSQPPSPIGLRSNLVPILFCFNPLEFQSVLQFHSLFQSLCPRMRETDTQTDRQTDIQTDRQTDRQHTNREAEIDRDT